jgi:WD40 repeat protein
MKRTATALAIALLLVGCASDSPPVQPVTPRSPSPTDQIELPKDNTLLFLGGTTLYTTNTKTKNTKAEWDLGTTDVSIAPDGLSYAYPLRGPRQIVIVRRVGEKKGVEVVGRSPAFSLDGKYLAVAIDDPNYMICPTQASQKKHPDPAQGCVAAARVSAYRTADLQKKPLLALGAGLWDVVGWTDGDIVAYSKEEGALGAGAPGGAANSKTYALPGAEILALAPDGLQVIVNQGQIPYMGDPKEPLGPVNVDGRIDAAAWSPLGDRILLAVTKDGVRNLQILDVETRGASSVEGSEELVGPPVWSTDGQTFAYVTGKGRSFRADICDVELDCAKLFDSDAGISLLYLGN